MKYIKKASTLFLAAALALSLAACGKAAAGQGEGSQAGDKATAAGQGEGSQAGDKATAAGQGEGSQAEDKATTAGQGEGSQAGGKVTAAGQGEGKEQQGAEGEAQQGAGNNAQQGVEGKAQQGGSEIQTVHLGYLPITHALALLEEKELLDAEAGGLSIELEKFSTWPDLMDALNAGRIDGASVLIELAMGAASQGIDLKAAALGHKDGNVVVVSDKVQAAADLKGKSFAIPHTQSSHNILLKEVLEKGGLTAEDVSIVQLSPSEMPSSLASGVIDGYCVAEPFGAQAVSKDLGHVLYRSEELWEDSLCCGLVLNGAFLEENPETAKQLVEKYHQAGKALDADKAKEVAAKYLGQEDSVLELSLQWIQFDDLAITKEAYQSLSDKVKAYGINDNPPAFEDFIYEGAE